jgi:predicted nucleotidyltransferase
MTHVQALDLARSVIFEECARADLQVVRLVLFGSQARGTARNDSDWDFLVVVKHDPAFVQTVKVASAIRTRLAAEHMAVDVIIKSEQRVEKERDDVGAITHYALKEGTSL